MKLGIIGGTGFQDLFDDRTEQIVVTEHGEVSVYTGTCEGKSIVFISRHGKKHEILAPYVNYKANIMALKELGVERIISVSAVGAINERIEVGSIGVLGNFIDWTTRGSSYGKYSVDMTDPFCPEINDAFSKAAADIDESINKNLQLMCVEGPRYETRAEILMFRQFGMDVVGMTSSTEAALARELGMCYGVITLTTNMAAGVTDIRPSLKVHKAVGERKNNTMKALVTKAVDHLAEKDSCTCSDPYERAMEIDKNRGE